jgi:hypothetical protein
MAFTGWATAQGLVALAVVPETVATYVDALAAQGRKPAPIRQSVWAIANPAPRSRHQAIRKVRKVTECRSPSVGGMLCSHSVRAGPCSR